MQRSLFEFAASSTASLRAARERREEQELERRNAAADAAKAIGLDWPQRRGRTHAGRPSRQSLWEAALYMELETSVGTLPPGFTLAVPSWWTRGKPVHRPMADVIADLKEAAPQQPHDQAEPTGQGGQGGQMEQAPVGELERKKENIWTPQEAKDWFLQYWALKKRLHN